MTKKNIWVLFDSITQIQSQALEQEQLQSAIYKMQKSDLQRFFVWTTGWKNWQALNLFLDSDQVIFVKDIETAKKLTQESSRRKIKKNSSEKTLTKTKTMTKSITKSMTLIRLNGEITKTSFNLNSDSAQFNGDNLTWSGSEPPKNLHFSKNKMSEYAQRATRHELKIEVLLISAKGKTFRSYSKNISLSGTKLEDNVPFDYYGNTFDIVIVSRAAENPANSRVQLKCTTVGEGLTPRLQFQHVSFDQKKRLTVLLNEYIEKQKSKKAA